MQLNETCFFTAMTYLYRIMTDYNIHLCEENAHRYILAALGLAYETMEKMQQRTVSPAHWAVVGGVKESEFLSLKKRLFFLIVAQREDGMYVGEEEILKRKIEVEVWLST
jgi:hypothetical protein